MTKDYRLTSVILLTAVFSLLFTSSRAEFRFDDNCQKAMQAILDLRMTDARALIKKEKIELPDNGYIVYLEHYTDAIELVITEDIAIYQRLMDSLDIRMAKMDELDDGSPDNSWLKAEMLFHAGLAQVKFGSRFNGAVKLLSSYRKTRSHRQKYPGFWQNQKLTGIFNILLDNIPAFMRWAADLFGISGSSEIGIYQLRMYAKLASGTPGLAEEGVMVTNLGYKLIHQEEEGFRYISIQEEKILENTLVKYLYALTASYTFRNDSALRALGALNEKKLQVKFYSLAYLTGRCKLNHLESDANVYLEAYLVQYPGLDFKKDACNRLSYYYFLQGNMNKYEEYRVKVASVGQELRERDQEAQMESLSTLAPQPVLLKARFLCDGGYFDKAMDTIKQIHPAGLPQKAYQLEYYYRLGRIEQLKGNPDEAIPQLTRAYREGKSYPYTFATRAAYFLGQIYERKSEYQSADTWYKNCLEIFSPDHTPQSVKDDAEKGEKRTRSKF